MPFQNVNWDAVIPNEGGAVRRPEPGGYVVCVVGVQDVEDKTGAYLNVDFDIAEGPYAGVYTELYKMFPDNWGGHIRLYYKWAAKRGPRAGQIIEDYGRVKAWLTALEKSNGINIKSVSEKLFQALANERKIFGVLMGYDQKSHKYLNAYQTRSADVIRAGDYVIPEEWKIRYDNSAKSGYGGSGGQSAPPPDDDDDMPF